MKLLQNALKYEDLVILEISIIFVCKTCFKWEKSTIIKSKYHNNQYKSNIFIN